VKRSALTLLGALLVLTVQPLSADDASAASPLGIRAIPEPLSLSSLWASLAGYQNKSLVQTVKYLPSGKQFVHTERLIVDPGHQEYKLVGFVNDESNLLFGCARVGNEDFVYSDKKKKWILTSPGGSLFMAQNNLSQIRFLNFPAVVAIYKMALSEFNLGTSASNMSQIANALDEAQTIDIGKVTDSHPAVLNLGARKIEIHVDSAGLIRAVETFDQGLLSSSLQNNFEVQPRITLPNDQIVRSLPASIATASSSSNDALIKMIDTVAAKRPVFGFSFAKTTQGLVVSAIQPNSVADKAGLKAGMIIETIDGVNPSAMDIKALTELFSLQNKVQMQVNNNSKEQAITLTKD
jgi:hypothetical protein